MKGFTIIAIAGAAFICAGCATKRYPIATPLSRAEATLMDCKALELEMIRAEQVQQQITETGRWDGKSLLGVLGDFGIGNSMARTEAQDALNTRMSAIRRAQAQQNCLYNQAASH